MRLTLTLSPRQFLTSMTSLSALWKRLQCISRFTFHSKSPSWDRKGEGKVKVKASSNSLIFEERGEWTDAKNTLSFTNQLRWGLEEKFLTLEHLRQNDPVFLLDFIFQKGRILSHNNHLCGDDLYKGEITLKPEQIQFNWHVSGPKKAEKIEIIYS